MGPCPLVAIFGSPPAVKGILTPAGLILFIARNDGPKPRVRPSDATYHRDMGFLRRILRGDERPPAASSEPSEDEPQPEDAALDAEVLRVEDARLDEFRRRQLRYARFSWRPPAQGGERRADDGLDGDANGER